MITIFVFKIKSKRFILIEQFENLDERNKIPDRIGISQHKEHRNGGAGHGVEIKQRLAYFVHRSVMVVLVSGLNERTSESIDNSVARKLTAVLAQQSNHLLP